MDLCRSRKLVERRDPNTCRCRHTRDNFASEKPDFFLVRNRILSSQLFQFEQLFAELHEEGAAEWAADLRERVQRHFVTDPHGDLPKWIEAWNGLPQPRDGEFTIEDGVVTINDVETERRGEVEQHLRTFHPWRKGPFNILGTAIDTEWRSCLKWSRVAGHVEFRNRSVLDVGCGNGYYGWHMLQAGARRVIGLDPFPLYVMQHEAVKKSVPHQPNYVLPAGDDCLPRDLNLFDVTLSMGVLYHRSSPIDHLQTLAGTLRRGGTLLLETIIVEESQPTVLVPNGRYAKMRNVWFLPSVAMLEIWLQRTGFRDVSVIDVSATTSDEQRRTDWMTFESLADFLDPHDPSKTIEGYPAPVRAVVTAKRG